MTGRRPEESLLDVLRPALADTGLDVEAVEVSAAGRRSVVRVLVDRDGGVTLDDIAAATPVVSQALDAAELLGERPYTLEVTSPGIDRPLATPARWRRNIGRLVAVTLADGSAVSGRIAGTDGERVSLDVDGTPRELDLDEVAVARIQVEFTRPRAAKEA